MDEYKVVTDTLSDKSVAYNVVGNGITFGAVGKRHADRLCRALNETAWTQTEPEE